MKRFAGSALALCVCLTLGFGAPTVFARLTASVDRADVAIGETLRLTLTGDAGERPDEIDLRGLERDFEILNRSSTTSARLVNGSQSVTRTLELELAPRREGLMTIPSFSAGGRNSTPIAIKVSPAPDIDAGDALVLFDAALDRDSVYVQAQLMLTLTLQQAINLDQRKVDPLEIPGAEVQVLEQRTFQRQINGRLWQVYELRYAIFPQQSGVLEIPALSFSGREILPGRSLLGARLGRRLSISTEPATVTVKPVPDDFPGAVWLPARQLSIEERWSKAPESLRLGDSTTRTLNITAEGLMGAQIPPIESLDPQQRLAGLRFYPGEEAIDQTEASNGLVGLRSQSEALVPNQAGQWSLPERLVPWWNTETDTLQYARVPARSIEVANPAISPSVDASVPSRDSASTWSQRAPQPPSTLLVATAGAGWMAALIFAALWWRKRDPKQPASGPGDTPESERRALVALRLACQQADPASARAALVNWAKLRFNQNIVSLADIAHYATPELSEAIDALNRAHYTDSHDAWDGHPLFVAARDCPAQVERPASTSPNLYPAGL